MEEKSTILGALKVLFGVETEVTPIPSILDKDPAELDTFLDVVTVDGITLRVAEMAEGVECYHVNEEGVETLCEEGAEYVLESGEKITIGAEGRIAMIEAAEVEVEIEEDMAKKKEMYSEEETSAEVVEAVTEEAFAKVSEIETLRQANIMLAEQLDALTARVEAFAKAPSAEPVVTTTAFNKSKQVLTTAQERLAFFGSK